MAFMMDSENEFKGSEFNVSESEGNTSGLCSGVFVQSVCITVPQGYDISLIRMQVKEKQFYPSPLRFNLTLYLDIQT